jgi:hypothetical protein
MCHGFWRRIGIAQHPDRAFGRFGGVIDPERFRQCQGPPPLDIGAHGQGLGDCQLAGDRQEIRCLHVVECL